MYGLETTIMLPLVAGLALEASRPFFASDIAATLALVPPPRLLVTTPAHLRVAVDAGIDWPELALVLSATAPLSRRLAAAAEETFAAPVMEIYGFTEAGSIASRRTVDDDVWTLYDGIAIKNGSVLAAHLGEPVPMADHVELHGGNRIALLGRHQDMVNIAGKRTSLAYLNTVLNDVEGVADGAFVIDEASGERSPRLMALVAAPGVNRATIMAALARRIDPLFLPRPLVLVDRLPRNETGKLPREDVATLVRELAASRRG
jgi:acyl-coenzyme A synthetase/AMP-(fatty) acid ligase